MDVVGTGDKIISGFLFFTRNVSIFFAPIKSVQCKVFRNKRKLGGKTWLLFSSKRQNEAKSQSRSASAAPVAPARPCLHCCLPMACSRLSIRNGRMRNAGITSASSIRRTVPVRCTPETPSARRTSASITRLIWLRLSRRLVSWTPSIWRRSMGCASSSLTL